MTIFRSLVPYKIYIWRFVNCKNRFLLIHFTFLLGSFLLFLHMKNSSAFKVTSDAIVSDDSFCEIFCPEQELNMTVDKSAI